MGYLILIVVLAVFAGIIVICAKKEKEILDNFLANLTEEQKTALEDNQIEDYDSKKYTWTQRGMIASVKMKGERKVALKVLWYNTVIQNNTIYRCQYADINMKKADFDEKGLKNGDFVRIFIDPEKGGKIVGKDTGI